MNLFSFNLKVIIFILILNLNAFSEIIENIKINGNQRISNSTIKLFSNIDIGDEINSNDINKILKDLYETNFFENVNIKFLNNNSYKWIVQTKLMKKNLSNSSIIILVNLGWHLSVTPAI